MRWKLNEMIENVQKHGDCEILSDAYRNELEDLGLDNLSIESLSTAATKVKKTAAKIWKKIKDITHNLFMSYDITEKVWMKSMNSIKDPSTFKIHQCVAMGQLKEFFIDFNKVVANVNRLYQGLQFYTRYKNNNTGGLIANIGFPIMVTNCLLNTDFNAIGDAMSYKQRFTFTTKVLTDDNMDKFETWDEIGSYYKVTRNNVCSGYGGYRQAPNENFNILTIFNKTLREMVLEQYQHIHEAEKWIQTKKNLGTLTAKEQSEFNRSLMNTQILIMFLNNLIHVFTKNARYFENMWSTIVRAAKR